MANKLIQLSLPEELLKKVDEAAKEEFATRSEFIRSALTERIKTVDEYRIRLAAAAFNTDVPTEEMIFKWLRFKSGKRWFRVWEREMRKPEDKQNFHIRDY